MKLYVIGNGFDVSHGISCKYYNFYDYLIEKRCDILEIMEKFYYVDKDSDLWSDFERSLEEDIDYDSLLEIISENTPNLASDDFYRELSTAQIYIKQECDELLKNIRSGFEEWIESLDISQVSENYKLDISAYFITFNYTDVLERIYKIPVSNILHIHNKVGEELIFGHGKKSENFNVKEALYGDENVFLSKDEYGNIESNEIGHEKFAEYEVSTFYERMRKHTEDVIQNHTHFFDNLSEISEVIVLGHSYNEIDLPYFSKINKSINKEAKWILSYYSDKDRESAEKVMKAIEIPVNLQEYKYCDKLRIEHIQLKRF